MADDKRDDSQQSEPMQHQDNDEHHELDELERLCEAVIEDRFTEADRDRIEQLVLGSDSLRRFYVQRMHLNANLAWPDTIGAIGSTNTKTNSSQELQPSPFKSVLLGFTVTRRHVLAFTAIALVLLTAVIPIALMFLTPIDRSVATLLKTDRCRWKSCSMSTEPGTRLCTDDIQLEAGLAHLRFDNDVDLYLEGPCHLKIVSGRRCFLYSGQLAATVGPAGIGFTIETPTAEIEDFGTEFGVTVRDDLSSEVEVFKGRVDVRETDESNNRSNSNSDVTSMTAGQRARFGATASDSHQTNSGNNIAGMSDVSQRIVRLSTAMLRGKATSVQPEVSGEFALDIPHESDVYLLIKNSRFKGSQWNRKAYFTIDLSDIRGESFNDCQLQMSFGPTGVGFSSRSPEESVFSVYGLTDQTQDDWSASSINWANAPANGPGGADVDPTKTVLLGRFSIPRSEPSGMRTVSGDALRRFLQDDTNALATFIVTRDTPEIEQSALAHGIANNQHPELPPPTLRLTLDE